MLIITGIFMCFSSPIQFISPSNQAVCIHEAGHIVMALTLGYDVVGAALFYGPLLTAYRVSLGRDVIMMVKESQQPPWPQKSFFIDVDF